MLTPVKPKSVVTVAAFAIVGMIAFTAWTLWPVWQEHRAVESLLDVLQRVSSRQSQEFDSAVEQVKQFRGGAAAVPPLIERLESEDAITHNMASFALAVLQPASTPILEQLCRDRSRPPRVRAGALWALGSMRNRSVFPLLFDGLKDPDPFVRYRCVSALYVNRPQSRVAVEAFKAALDDAEFRVRRMAAMALCEVEPLLEGEHPDEKTTSDDYAMGSCPVGPDAVAAIPVLIEVLRSDDADWWRAMAGQALRRIGPSAKEALPAMIESLRDPQQTTWYSENADAFGLFGPSEDQIAEVVAMLRDPELTKEKRSSVMYAIGGIGPPAMAVVPDLTALVHDPNYGRAARWALRRIDPDALAAALSE